MAKISSEIYVVILCGGGGKRLWPVSTRQKPKQFISILGEEKTLFQETVERAKLLAKPENIWVITGKDYLDFIHKQAPEISNQHIIIEPEAKNTAMAHIVSSFFIYKEDPHAIIVNLASDHFIPNNKEFARQMKIALRFLKESDYILTVGIKPTHPDVNYGYIKQGKEIKKINNWPFYEVAEFKEKPDLKTAKKYCASGKYFWNACLYSWRVDTFLETVKKVNSVFWQSGKEIFDSIGTSKFNPILKKNYQKAENVSIDYAISEKANNLVLFPASFFWSDVGNWQAAYRLSDKDKQENVLLGKKQNILTPESKGNLIKSEKKQIVAFGLKDMIIIETAENILVSPLEKAADIGIISEIITKKNK
jgi:mannose-1-phosphate guanylyltransferase